MLDGRGGLSEADSEALALVRETGCPLIMAVNKIDRPGQEAEASEFYALGGDELFFISAAHGRGVEELLDQVVARLPQREGSAAPAPDLRLALIGRPNVGKSSLLNRLSGFDRAIVDDTPGTTRDPVDVRLSANGRDVLLIDTAGIRRPPRVEGELEHHSVGRAIETIRRAERRASGYRRERRNHRPGRAAGAAGGHQRSCDGHRVQQMGRCGEGGAQGGDVRSRRA